jgi:hypothetical protein
VGTFFHFVSKLADHGPFSALDVGFHCNECGSIHVRSWISTYAMNLISGVMVHILASSAVDRGFEPRSGKAKDDKIGIC